MPWSRMMQHLARSAQIAPLSMRKRTSASLPVGPRTVPVKYVIPIALPGTPGFYGGPGSLP